MRELRSSGCLLRQLFDAGLSSWVVATLLLFADVSGGLDIAGETYAAMPRERDRIDANIAHIVQTRDALDVLLKANSRYPAELSATPTPLSA